MDDMTGTNNGAQQPMQPVNPETVKVIGSLKFFYENDNYGFLVGDQDGKDVFFHFDDMKEAGMTKEKLITAREQHCLLRFAYNKLAYFGRHGLSMKAINIELLEIIPV